MGLWQRSRSSLYSCNRDISVDFGRSVKALDTTSQSHWEKDKYHLEDCIHINNIECAMRLRGILSNRQGL
jgi:hypothetical protein